MYLSTENMNPNQKKMRGVDSMDGIMNRIKDIEKISTDSEICVLLGISRSSLSGYRNREAIPYKEIVNYAVEKGVSIDFLITGLETQETEQIDALQQTINEQKAIIDYSSKLIRSVVGKE
jgi:transcriptional regulator with XRE-family HTH domain